MHGFSAKLQHLMALYYKTIRKYLKVSDRIKECEALKHHKTRDKYLQSLEQDNLAVGLHPKKRTRDPVVCFVTFTSDEAKNEVLKSFGRLPSRQRPRLRRIRTARGESGVSEKMYPITIRDAQAPDDIQFEYLETPYFPRWNKHFWSKQNKSKFFRRLRSIWVSVVALLCTSAVIYMLNVVDDTISSSSPGYASMAKIFASLLINITNKVIQRVLGKLSESEHHGLRTAQSASYILKSFIATTLNSVVVVCLSDWDFNLPWNKHNEHLVRKFGR